MLNRITVMGRIVRDIELRNTNSGIPVASFTIACDRDFSGKDGGEKETDFIDCVAWRNTGEFVAKYFTKGRMIVVSGRLQIRSWTDKDSNKRRSAEIVADNVYFGDSKKEENQSQQPQYGGYQGAAAPQYGQGHPSYNNNQQSQQPHTQSYAQPQFNQQGFGGYQQPGYNPQSYMHCPPGFTLLDSDEQLPF